MKNSQDNVVKNVNYLVSEERHRLPKATLNDLSHATDLYLAGNIGTSDLEAKLQAAQQHLDAPV